MTQEQIQVYAVVRHDRFQQSADPQVAISVKEVLPTLEAAEAEVRPGGWSASLRRLEGTPVYAVDL